MKGSTAHQPQIDWNRYKGSIVMIIDNQVYSTKDPKKVPKMVEEIHKKHHKWPVINQVPKAGTLILYF